MDYTSEWYQSSECRSFLRDIEEAMANIRIFIFSNIYKGFDKSEVREKGIVFHSLKGLLALFEDQDDKLPSSHSDHVLYLLRLVEELEGYSDDLCNHPRPGKGELVFASHNIHLMMNRITEEIYTWPVSNFVNNSSNH